MTVLIYEGAKSQIVQNGGSCQSLLGLMVELTVQYTERKKDFNNLIYFNNAWVNVVVLDHSLV